MYFLMLLTLLVQKPNIFAYRTHVGMSVWLGLQAKRSKKKEDKSNQMHQFQRTALC